MECAILRVEVRYEDRRERRSDSGKIPDSENFFLPMGTPHVSGCRGRVGSRPGQGIRTLGASGALSGPRHRGAGPTLRPLQVGQYAHPASLHRNPLGGGTRLERSGALPGLERHSQRPSTSLAGRGRTRERLPVPLGKQQREYVRLPGTSDLLRTWDPAGCALRAGRHGHGAGRRVGRETAQRSQRRGGASGRRRHLVHRSRIRESHELRGAQGDAPHQGSRLPDRRRERAGWTR